MFYRVDYQLALIVAGALAAVLLAGRMARLEGSRLARGYLVATAALTAAGVVRFVLLYALGVHVLPQALGAAFGDLGTALLGSLLGIASVHGWRGGFAELLRAPEVLLAVCLSTGVTFVLAGIGKVFGMDFMLDFFAQSGYSKSFLLFIVTVEILGGMALVLPWRWLVLAATFGLGVDMLGAIYTHIHNHDPLDDSTGAIALLLRLATIAILIVGRRRALGVAAAAVVCAALAVVGSRLVRQPASNVGSGELDYSGRAGSLHARQSLESASAPGMSAAARGYHRRGVIAVFGRGPLLRLQRSDRRQPGRRRLASGAARDCRSDDHCTRRSTGELGKRAFDMKVDYAVRQIRSLLPTK